MLLGILIGILFWQVVIFILHCFDLEDSWVTTPIPYFCMKLCEFIKIFFLSLLDIQAYIYLMTLGKNPFNLKICDLLTLNEEQREKMIEKTKCKRAKNNLKKLFENNLKIY